MPKKKTDIDTIIDTISKRAAEHRVKYPTFNDTRLVEWIKSQGEHYIRYAHRRDIVKLNKSYHYSCNVEAVLHD